MRPGVYKHTNNTDVAMRVVKSYFITEKNGWKVKVNWINIVNPANPFVITDSIGPLQETHLITREQAKDWKPFDVKL